MDLSVFMVWFVVCISIATCKGLFQIPGIILMAAGWSGFCMSDKWSWIHSLKTVANTVTELTVKSAFLIWHAVIGFTTWHWFNFRGVNCLGGGVGGSWVPPTRGSAAPTAAKSRAQTCEQRGNVQHCTCTSARKLSPSVLMKQVLFPVKTCCVFLLS